MAGNRLTNARDLARQYEMEPTKFVEHITESLESGKLKPADFCIREMAEATLGYECVESFRPKSGRQKTLAHLLEADSVRYADFSALTGQIYFTEFMTAFESPEFVFTKLIPSVQTNFQDMEKIGGVSRIGDESEVVAEGESYPRVGPSEDFIHIGPKKKRGEIVEVTKEAVFGAKNFDLLKSCRDLGWGMGVNREKRTIDCLIDENDGAQSATLGGHRFRWRDTDYASYQTTTPWVNVVTSNGLVNDLNLRSAWQALVNMRDPFTGEPINYKITTIMTTTQNAWAAKAILRTLETRADTNPSAGTAGRISIFPNPVQDNIPDLRIATSPWLDDRAATDTDWWIGAPEKFAKRYYNWDVSQEEAPTNHFDMFQRDIVYEVKIHLKDIISTVQPRALVENRA